MHQNPCSTITLRPFELSDIDDFMEWATDDRVSRYCRWETFTSKDNAMTYLKNRIMVHPWSKAICLENKPVGRISVKPHSGNDRCRADLSYVVASKYWAKGIATEAVKMVIASIFKEWPHLERLEALVEVENIGSQKVLEKAGFMKEGVLRKYFILKGSIRDVAVYSFLPTAVVSSSPEMAAGQLIITLRPFKLSDVDDFMVWATDDRVLQFIRLNKFTSKEEALIYLREVAIPHPWRRSICLDDRSIGFVSIFPGSGEYLCRGDIGYALAVQYWGQGIGTLAVKLAISSVFQDFPHMERLQALVDVENKASQRVLEKAGFLREGLLRKYRIFKGKTKDLVSYSFSSTDSISSCS